MEIINSLIKSFVLTFVIEYIIIRLIFRERKAIKSVLLVNLLTNPFVVYVYNLMSLCSFEYKDIILIFLELIVVIVEGYVYKLLLETNLKKTLLISCVANVIAYLTGILLSLYF